MSRFQYVSGGVGPPKVEVLSAGGAVLRTVVLAESAKLNESYELVTVRNSAVTGGIVDVPRGYRYRADIDFATLVLDEWREVVRLFSDYNAGKALRFYPHDDEPGVFYKVVPGSGVALPYLQGRYLGYEGKVSFVGVEVLDYVPCPASFSFFCSADETGYDPGEVSHFTDAEEEGYAAGEISWFSGTAVIGQREEISVGS
ncbi:MAG: hypothetical protein JSW52_10915 [Candidatus Coatesbacteria bacterium]|nr:MAG: hypothetical protein JSW52_10915 [Candidatus Coatesbacteria bacterium]